MSMKLSFIFQEVSSSETSMTSYYSVKSNSTPCPSFGSTIKQIHYQSIRIRSAISSHQNSYFIDRKKTLRKSVNTDNRKIRSSRKSSSIKKKKNREKRYCREAKGIQKTKTFDINTS